MWSPSLEMARPSKMSSCLSPSTCATVPMTAPSEVTTFQPCAICNQETGSAIGATVPPRRHNPGVLDEIARALVAPGKGILAADESGGTIKKRFDAIGVDSTEENRRAYRDLLFTAEGAEEWISGVILYDETIRQSSADGTPF